LIDIIIRIIKCLWNLLDRPFLQAEPATQQGLNRKSEGIPNSYEKIFAETEKDYGINTLGNRA